MKLYQARIPAIAREIVRTLREAGHIETDTPDEAQLDIESVLKEYLRREREVTDETKDTLERRKLPYDQFGKVKRLVAEKRGHVLGDEGLSWMGSQIVETFMQSQFVEEVYATDAQLRRAMSEILRRHMSVDDELDADVRAQIKNLQEGTGQWDVEYARVMEQVKRKRGLA